MHAVSGFYERAARRAGLPRPRAGAVAFVQRFDSGLRVNLHFHVLWLDGVYAWEPGRAPVFAEHGELTDVDVAKLVRVVRDRVRRCLHRLGSGWTKPTRPTVVTRATVGGCCQNSRQRRCRGARHWANARASAMRGWGGTGAASRSRW